MAAVTVERTELEEVLLVTPPRFGDERGFFVELFRADEWAAAGLPTEWRQVNQSRSRRGVTRGLHFQWDPPQGKLMRVIAGAAYVVALDIRPGSPTLGRWVGTTLTADEPRYVWAPPWYARGFRALADGTDVEYFVTDVYDAASEGGIRFDDPELGIAWPEVEEVIVSPKDAAAPTLREWLARPEAALVGPR